VTSSQRDADKELELILRLVTEMKSDIENMSASADIVNLALERTVGKFPSTFIIKPQALAPLPLSPFFNHQAYDKPF
jgi:hypothetical protein